MSRIAIYGSSDQGRCTVDVVRREGRHEIVGFLDDRAVPGTQIYRAPILGPGSDLVELRKQYDFDAVIVAIGDNFVRALVAAELTEADPTITFATAIDPSVTIGTDVNIGAGSVLMAQALVNGSSNIGRHVLLCARASLDHDSTLGDFVSLGPSATTGGRVSIGHHTALGLGASVIHGMTIGDHSVIGAGSTVVEPIGAHLVAYGNPCRPVRSREPGDHYL